MYFLSLLMVRKKAQRIEMGITSNIKQLQASIPEGVTLVAVSKFHPVEALQEAYDAGQRIFGENKAQELYSKQEVLPKDIQWHFIGHLQSNKIKVIAPFVHTIHSIDSAKLLQEVDKQAARNNRNIRVLLQIYIAKEETKFGLSPEECVELIQSGIIESCKHVTIAGLMGMATNTEDETQVSAEFHKLHAFFTELKASYFANKESFCELSMGMSHDYPLAIAQGSTMIRVGSLIFGERSY